jgi:hypothetical protein
MISALNDRAPRTLLPQYGNNKLNVCTIGCAMFLIEPSLKAHLPMLCAENFAIGTFGTGAASKVVDAASMIRVIEQFFDRR